MSYFHLTSFHLFYYAGDVVTPGFFKKYMNCEDIFRKPYGGAEMNMFNFAYNLLTLRFKKANKQLPPDVLKTALSYLNIGMFIGLDKKHILSV